MKPFYARIAGTTLIITAILGVVLSAGGMIVTGIYSARLTANLTEALSGVSDTLVITSESLDLSMGVLTEASTALDALVLTMEAVDASLEASKPTMDELSSLLGTDLPETIKSTQDSLASAQTSAKNIDAILTTLSKFPFLGSLVYNPDIPLNVTLGEISDSLDGFPTSLSTAQRSLDRASKNFESISGELDNISASADEIGSSTEEAKLVIKDYQEVVSRLQSRVAGMQTSLPRTLNWVKLVLVILLIWLGLAQIGLILQGCQLLAQARQKPAPLDVNKGAFPIDMSME